MRNINSIRKNSEFQDVYRNGKSYANRYLVMYVRKNQSDCNKLGISVSKKVGNSVVRHHIVRLIRESYRLNRQMFNNGLNIVIVARVNASQAGYREIESAMLHLCRLHKIVSLEPDR